MLQTLDSGVARRWAALALGALGAAREEIDALNVFPVPDGDTGTNMYLTLEAAVSAAAALPADAGVDLLADAFARGALLGARGNSGVIVAQLLRGWAQTLSEHTRLSAESAVEGFRRADEQAWQAVNEPIEGTILSVSRAAANAASAALALEPTLAAVMIAAAAGARAALERTTGQLPALARAGVVDAGGKALVVLIDSLAELVLGAAWAVAPRQETGRRPGRPTVTPPCRDLRERRSVDPGYEVMFLLDTTGFPAAGTPNGTAANGTAANGMAANGTAANGTADGDGRVARLRSVLAGLGDSLVMVGDEGLWQVHVHVRDPGAAIEAALAAGRSARIRISHLAGRTDPTVIGLVACAAGPGLADLFAGAGAVVVRSEPGRRPSTAELLAALVRTGADQAILLPNDGRTLSVARAAAAAARDEGMRVTVIPTRAQVQGLAAAGVHDPARGFDEDVVSMSSAAGAARDGALTLAGSDGLTSAGECRAGDVLGVVDGDFAVVGAALQEVALEVVERLLSGGGELVTLVVGAGGFEPLARAVAAHVEATRPQVDVSVLDGGQHRYPLLIGVE